jgi:phospholipid transport system substrate-binding protein
MPAVSVQAKRPGAPGRRAVLGAAMLALVAPALLRARPAAAADAATAPVERLNAALVQAMRAGSGTAFAQRYAALAPAVDASFDLGAVLRTSIGPRWDTIPAADQQQLQDVFRRYTVASFVANFDTYAGETAQVSPTTRDLPNGDKVVDSKIGAVSLSYVMRPSAGGWRAVDVLADGSISRVAVQRSDFRSLLSRGGGPALVASLQQKVADLSRGSLA